MREFIKKFLPSNSMFYKLISKAYNYNTNNNTSWMPPNCSSKKVLNNYSKLKSDVNFIQIGSNDGVSGDPLFEFINNNNWKGILVEPVPSLFERLKSNYNEKTCNLFFENSAISKKDGTAKFYRLKESDDPNVPKWYDQLGSFNKEIVIRHKAEIPNFDSLLIEEDIPTTSFSTLLKKHNFYNVNLIHIDTEGYDFEILKLINFDQIHPDVILYEHKHLHPIDHKKSILLLKNKGYKLYIDGRDTLAIIPSLTSIV